mgnify:CR=1 FL=1
MALAGIAVRFACLSCRAPDAVILKVFLALSDRIKSASGLKAETVSGSNSVNLEWLHRAGSRFVIGRGNSVERALFWGTYINSLVLMPDPRRGNDRNEKEAIIVVRLILRARAEEVRGNS